MLKYVTLGMTLQSLAYYLDDKSIDKSLTVFYFYASLTAASFIGEYFSKHFKIIRKPQET